MAILAEKFLDHYIKTFVCLLRSIKLLISFTSIWQKQLLYACGNVGLYYLEFD